jgi:hypothetical protein
MTALARAYDVKLVASDGRRLRADLQLCVRCMDDVIALGGKLVPVHGAGTRSGCDLCDRPVLSPPSASARNA